jgi:hypothetical protein
VGLTWESLGIHDVKRVMVAHVFARRSAALLVALLVATTADTPNAYAAEHQHAGVKRLWSQFPIGPNLRTPPATQTSPTPPSRRLTPDRSQPGDATSARRAGGRGLPPWAWGLLTGAAAMLVAAIVWLRYLPRWQAPTLRRRGSPPEPTRHTPAPPTQHPWTSGGPRTLDTLPRAELFAMANALGIEHTVVMSRAELIEALRPEEPVAGAASSAVSDRELVRCAAVYSAACRAGNPAPILAVTAMMSPAADEPAAYSKQMVAEARRRGLLTSHRRGMPGGELTARARALLVETAPPTRRRSVRKRPRAPRQLSE